MRRIITIALLLIGALSLALVRAPKNKKSESTDPIQAIEARQQAYLEALRKGDIAAIGQCFSYDYTFTTASGKVMTKAQRLDSFKSSPPPSSLTFSELKVRVYGDTAVVTGRDTSQVGPNGQAIDQRQMCVWVKKADAWRIVAEQATSIEGASTAVTDTPEKFIQGSWRTEGSDPAHRLSWVLEWAFDHGTFRLSGYPPLEQKGNYRILTIEGNKLTLELYNQNGNFGTQNTQIEVIVDNKKDTLMIKGQGPFQHNKT